MDLFKIIKLQLSNFRNLTADPIEFSPHINCIFGNNGNGKTNLLESIYFLFKKKSFRKNTGFPQMLGMDGDHPEITFSSLLESLTDSAQNTLTGKFGALGHMWYWDSKPAKKTKLEGIYFINPFDSYAFHTIPSFRRDWFNDVFGQLDKNYQKLWNRYQKILRMRNNLLAQKSSNFNKQVDALNPDFANTSVQMLNMRFQFIEQLTPFVNEIFQSIYDEKHLLEIILKSKFSGMDAKDIVNFLKSNFDQDCILGRTQYGIHRDDYVLHFDGINSFDFCSLGQQKMSFLALNFAYIELFRYKFKAYPIVLIDDISGELDRSRWQRLVNFLDMRNFQVFITTANENFQKQLKTITNSKSFFVEEGKIIPSRG